MRLAACLSSRNSERPFVASLHFPKAGARKNPVAPLRNASATLPDRARGLFMRSLFAVLLLLTSFAALAEGRCPPGQYPIGDQNVGGCAPIPGAGGGAAPAPVATGKWETRWGAIADDQTANARGVPVPTGASQSKTSKREAISAAVKQCEEGGGKKCVATIVYYNQCVALADPDKAHAALGMKSATHRAPTLNEAESMALGRCREKGGGECTIFYSACSMSEFKPFR